MKYCPSRLFLRIVLPVTALTVALWYGVLPELEDTQAYPVGGEIVFPEKRESVSASGGFTSWIRSDKIVDLRDWLEGSFDNLMYWDHNPWRRMGNRPYPGSYHQRQLESKDPKELAKAREIQRLAEAWMDRIMERYPELASPRRPVADESNGFLKWLDFADRMKALAEKDDSASMNLGTQLSAYVRDESPWDPAAARAWLAANASLMQELHAIGTMSESSSDGIAVERYGFISGRLPLEAAQALLMEARLAAESGDAAAAMNSVMAARGLADHFDRVESATALCGTMKIMIQLAVEKHVFADILPTLPPDARDADAWEAAVSPQVKQPAELVRYMNGYWATGVRQWILPAALDASDPLMVADSGELIDFFSAPYLEFTRKIGNSRWTDARPDMSFPELSGSGLSSNSRKIMENVFADPKIWADSWFAWKDGMMQSQSAHGLTQAAFTVMKGGQVPVDPLWGRPYRWDPATRTLSMPSGPEFEKMSIKPVVVPR